MSLIEALNDISDVIFPPRCLGCAETLHPQSGQLFCPACKEKIKFITDNICSVCGTTFLDSPAKSHLCGNCLENKTYFSCARAVVSYETIILHAIHQFKYGSNISIGALLASFMADFSFPDIDFTDYSLIIPVPLHIKRLRQRGFNQSLILAHALAKKWQIPVNFSLLKRHKFILTQTGLNKTERKQNIKGAFEVSDKKIIAGKNVILVDDVYTTGATINECAKTLIKDGTQKVTVLTLARVLQS
jgi:ComF family protein